MISTRVELSMRRSDGAAPAPAVATDLALSAGAELRFERIADGVAVRVLKIDGDLDVVVEGADVRV
jgi:hypothetical protein